MSSDKEKIHQELDTIITKLVSRDMDEQEFDDAIGYLKDSIRAYIHLVENVARSIDDES